MGRALLVTGILVALIAGQAAAAVPVFNITRYYSEAAFTAAIKPYTDAIARNPNDSEAHRWLGVAYMYAFRQYRLGLAPYGSGFDAKAAQSLERSLELKAQPAVMLALAEVYIVAGRPDKSWGVLERLMRMAPPLPLK
jgi:tetratricopeptide (TPR) repeat protein